MEVIRDRSHILTEKENPKSANLDVMSTEEIVRLMNEEDGTVHLAVRKAIPQIVEAIEIVFNTLKNGGRLFYVGAGTSGRLGVLDASECPPTFSVSPSLVQGIIAGGYRALRRAVEGAEDYPENGANDCKKRGVRSKDVVMGIATGGTTPYVHGALKYARTIGCKTIFLTCTPNKDIKAEADVIIEVLTGPEIITGSTRLKAGTATKMVLNMITTTTMVKLGKVYGNLMVDLQAINAKLVDRGSRIISKLTGLSYEESKKALFDAGRDVKVALVMIKKGVSREEARKLLKKHGGFVRFAFENHQQKV
ncbi:MAG: N-acetylmuramic acid 6-phosphate etherase [Candidatus Marinimicrobia bacterium]|nr:N-acetylmuramic acid 6-phosphate etherase [Candidatus Neomarinimicrobiota bacterium]